MAWAVGSLVQNWELFCSPFCLHTQCLLLKNSKHSEEYCARCNSNMLFVAALLVTILASAQATQPPQPIIPNLPTQLLTSNGSWHIFQFGNPHTLAQPHFQVYLAEPAILRVTDFWCTGDRFDVFAGDRYLGQTGPTSFDRCYTNTTDIEKAFHDPRWSSGTFEIGAGSYQIRIVPVESPSWTGVGAISLIPKRKPHPPPCPCPKPCPGPKHKCCRGRKGFHVIKKPMSFEKAEHACRAMGMRLADITIHNFNAATEVALDCSGRFSSSWIRSWNGDKYQGACLTLDTGVAAPGGAITTPRSCHQRYPAICQELYHEKCRCGSSRAHSSSHSKDSSDDHGRRRYRSVIGGRRDGRD